MNAAAPCGRVPFGEQTSFLFPPVGPRFATFSLGRMPEEARGEANDEAETNLERADLPGASTENATVEGEEAGRDQGADRDSRPQHRQRRDSAGSHDASVAPT